MENLTANEELEESAASLSHGKNDGKISRAIKRLRYDMRRQQPVNKIREQLKEIQPDYDKVVGLLTKLYRYTDEAASANLTEWESTLREDLLSLEHDVRGYDQEKHVAIEEERDTGEVSRSCETEQLSSTSTDVMSPPPEDLTYNRLLLKIADQILDCELEKMKFLFRGPGIITMRDLEDTSHPIEFFDKLRKSGHLAPNNIVALQAVLWNTGNIELFNEVTQFARGMEDMVYVSELNSTPANGYAHVKLHFKQRPLREKAEVVQQRTAAWFGVSLQFVSVVESASTNSWYTTLMIPEIFSEKFQKCGELNRKWFNEQGVNFMELNGRTIDVAAEKATDPLACTGDMGDISKPTLRFTEASNERMRITDEGAVVKAVFLRWMVWCESVTDGRFLDGRYYWELQIASSPGCYCYCRVGVVEEGRALRPSINPGSDSWYSGMEYRDDKVRCYSYCDAEIKPDYQQWRPHIGPHHLGVYLDCDQRSLTILDCGQNQVMATVRGLKVIQPLVPWVRFSCDESASARLVTGDSVTLPQVLCDMLFNNSFTNFNYRIPQSFENKLVESSFKM